MGNHFFRENKGEKIQKYSIKKLSVGVVSVLVGTSLCFAQSVSAEEIDPEITRSENSSEILTSSKEGESSSEDLQKESVRLEGEEKNHLDAENISRENQVPLTKND